ncbi:helix-turn-helix transcriptional regulator, partial [Streptomyces sp. NPDC020125]|uniref:helix-turn-helix domain-containing protein n=1 Tax=Streptomyces sp. NPDC020125 TaxID=3154593 RepID=UPI003408E39C
MSIGNLPEDGNSPEDDRVSIGRALQQARISAGLTVDEVSSSTRVRTPIVRGIEQDDFSRCGGDVYARGHIRVLARAVGCMDALVAAAKKEGKLNAIALPRDWANYGEIID